MKKVSITIISTLLAFLTVTGQEALSFEDALALTLENNYSIQLSEVDRVIASNNAERSALGYLPALTGTAGYNWTYYEGNNQTLQGDRTFEPNNSYNYNAGILLSYSLFDGFGRKFRYKQAQGNKALSDIQLKAVTENAVLQLSQVYHELARLEEQTESLDSTLLISQQRLQRAEYSYEYGQGTHLDILNARVDLDTDSINWLNSNQLTENTRRNLNLIMGVPIDNYYLIQEKIQLRKDLYSDEVVNSAMTKSSAILSSEQMLDISNMNIGGMKSTWYPNLGVSGGYQYRGSDDPNGAFLLGSSSYGPTAGISMTWNIFNGNNKTQLKNAKLQLESSELALQQSKEQLKTDALNAHGNYQNALFVLQASESTVTTARNNFKRTEESFKRGQISSIEFRQAQLNLLNAELQRSRALYDAKNKELEILALMGDLVN